MGTSVSKWLSGVALGVAISNPSVATVQAAPSHTLGVCQVATADGNQNDVELSPTSDANDYLADYYPTKNDYSFKKYMTDGGSLDGAAIKILAEPKHGKLVASDNINDIFRFTYLANGGFSGEDTFVLRVAKYGLQIQIHYTIEVPASIESPNGLCQLPREWKISRVNVENADGVQLASATFTPDHLFQGDSSSQDIAAAS